MLRAVVLAIFGALVFAACAPSPRSLPCENDGQCSKASPEYRYCLQSKCVECVGSPDCGEGNQCIAGACVRSCKDGRECKDGEHCDDHVCRKAE